MAMMDDVFGRSTRRTEQTADGIMPTLRCANPSCNTALGQAHFYGSGGVYRIFNCPGCGRGSEFTNGPRGIAASLLPGRAVPQAPRGTVAGMTPSATPPRVRKPRARKSAEPAPVATPPTTEKP